MYIDQDLNYSDEQELVTEAANILPTIMHFYHSLLEPGQFGTKTFICLVEWI